DRCNRWGGAAPPPPGWPPPRGPTMLMFVPIITGNWYKSASLQVAARNCPVETVQKKSAEERRSHLNATSVS
ncbi:MAG TPA: hypothetical protein VKA67_01645, partial [Verrucomicrobiae bacterium]|nr:hypothetical protein [Verrucomicrobiae bacterium]